MRQSWKIVAVTPAGRRRYLRLLVPYVLACPDIDRYDLWVNTPDPADLAFMAALQEVDPRIRLVHGDDGAEVSAHTIGRFWPQATDADSVYIRFDDDVVWLDPGFFDTLLAARLARREDFMVLPLIVNNALGSFLLQTFGKLTLSARVGPDRFDRTGWRNATLPVALHRLLQELIAEGEVGRLGCGVLPLSGNAFSINCMSWFGADIAEFGGILPDGEDEEGAFGCTIPLRLGRLNAVVTGAVAAHFAFFTQRVVMDASGLLDGYSKIAAARPELEPWRSRVEAVYARFERDHPVHEALGGFSPSLPRHPRRKLADRLLGRRGQVRAQKIIKVGRGPNF